MDGRRQWARRMNRQADARRAEGVVVVDAGWVGAVLVVGVLRLLEELMSELGLTDAFCEAAGQRWGDWRHHRNNFAQAFRMAASVKPTPEWSDCWDALSRGRECLSIEWMKLKLGLRRFV